VLVNGDDADVEDACFERTCISIGLLPLILYFSIISFLFTFRTAMADLFSFTGLYPDMKEGGGGEKVGDFLSRVQMFGKINLINSIIN